jgi:hypothetical protein
MHKFLMYLFWGRLLASLMVFFQLHCLCSSQLQAIYLSIYLSIYGSRALVDLRRFFSFLIYTQSVGLLGRGISQLQGRYLLIGTT